jgi:hypothetical protein
MYDDTDKKAKELKPEVTVKYKGSRKNAITKHGGKIGRKSAMVGNPMGQNPLNILTATKPRKKVGHKIDPYMVRQAKLLEANQTKGN